MTGKRRLLSPAERSRISDAVEAAEMRTSGEIVVLVAARAGYYRSLGLACALVAGLIAPWPLIWLTSLSAVWIAITQAIVVLAVLVPLLDPKWRMRIVPPVVRHARAHDAAHREFTGRGLTRTRERTGVLIYVALAERYAEIVADETVRARVHDARWRTTVEALLSEAGRGDLVSGIVAAVREVGDILAAELPSDGDDDELPNRVIVIE